MHPAVSNFVKDCVRDFPRGKLCRVLDCGSLDINGSNKTFFEGCKYTGVDLGEGPGVDVVSRVHELPIMAPFDIVVSTEMFEHDEFWEQSLRKMIFLTHKDGLMVFTCATTGRGEHGTTRTSPQDAPFTNSYYRNVTEEEVRPIVEPFFSKLTLRTVGTDLQFCGVRNDVDMSELRQT